jgi:hypothetical protein
MLTTGREQTWKASWVHALAGSNPASSAAPTRGDAEADPSGRRSRPGIVSIFVGPELDTSARLFQAVQRYTDGLQVAAEQLVGPQAVAEHDQADRYLPGLTTELAWPTLRAHLLALAAETGRHPLRDLLTAASGRDLQAAGDMAAVL